MKTPFRPLTCVFLCLATASISVHAQTGNTLQTSPDARVGTVTIPAANPAPMRSATITIPDRTPRVIQAPRSRTPVIRRAPAPVVRQAPVQAPQPRSVPRSVVQPATSPRPVLRPPAPVVEAPDPLLEAPDPLLASPPVPSRNTVRTVPRTGPLLPSKNFDFGFKNEADRISGMQVAGPIPFGNRASLVDGLQLSLGYGEAENYAQIVNGIQAAFAINGVNLVPIPYGLNDALHLNGAQFSFGANSADGGGGLQLGLLKNFAGQQGGTEKPFSGVQVALNNESKNKEYNGFQIGIINAHSIDDVDWFSPKTSGTGTLTSHYYGAQLGLVNNAYEITGLQIGLLNNARRLHGVQIGLFNQTHDHNIKWLPIINAGF